MFISPSKASAPWDAPAAIAPAAAQWPGGFLAESQRIHSEAVDFIEHGSAPARPAHALPALTPEGLWARERGGAAAADSGVDAQALAAPLDDERRAFLRDIAPHAKAAAQRLGVAPELVAAHAALESGWGARPLPGVDGVSGHNLFGIKAGSGWKGAAVASLTTEHLQGADVKRVEPFRAYANLSDAFADYTRLLADNPRYRGALGVGADARAFAAGLARGGYATDPRYADKLAAVAARVGRLD